MYSFVDKGIPGAPQQLPNSWRNISNLSVLDDNKLLELGWYPVVEEKDPINPDLEKYIGPTYVLEDDHVASVWAIEPLTADDKQARRLERYLSETDPLKAEAEAELKQGRPEKYFAYMVLRNKIRRETEPEETRLALAKDDQKKYWKTVCDNMLATRYPEMNCLAYNAQLTFAVATGKANRAAYIGQLFAWGSQLFTFYYTIAAQIDAEETVDSVLSKTIDFTLWLAADPLITAAGIEAIED
jgi:hypothetical protein